ncbi:MAG: hypothetical protein V1900_01015, partial [Candidatus Aenigmatarchaeota archaeon]
LVVLLSLPLGVLIFYLLGGFKLALVFAILWTDRMVISYTRILPEFGIELVSLPIIMSGILLGPFKGFAFAFIITPLLDSMQLFYKIPAFEEGWLPFIPSLYDFFKGVTAMIAGLLFAAGFLPFWILLICIVIKNAMYFVGDRLFGFPPRMAYILNIPFNIVLFGFFSQFFF